MAWYDGTYSCGCEGRTNIIGPTKNREWIRERHFEKLCPECWGKKVIEDREIANKEAKKSAKEMELPQLQGTEKQVAWANTLRQKMIDTFEKRIDSAEQKMSACTDANSLEKFKINVERLRKTFNFVLEIKVSSAWYIDTRNTDIEELFRNAGKEMDAIEEFESSFVQEPYRGNGLWKQINISMH